nr:MAG TPA: hypothetical protein [Bacteriophage sp.]
MRRLRKAYEAKCIKLIALIIRQKVEGVNG